MPTTTKKKEEKDKKKPEPSDEGQLPILAAAMYGRLEDLRTIVLHDPETVRAKEKDGWTIAHWAARRGFMTMLSFIADRAPALLLAQDETGAAPAHFAACYGHDGILTLMAERDPSALMVQDNEGNSPAHDATKHNRLVTLKVLVERCPSLIYGSNAKGQRAVDLAERDEIKQFLKESEKASMVPAVQLQNLTRETRELKGHNAVLALYCRNYWTTPGTDSKKKQFPVAEHSAEHSLVQVEFARTMARANLEAVGRVEDRPRLDRFLETRDAIRTRLGSKWEEETMERWLFYMQEDGEAVEHIVAAASSAFKPRTAELAKYGQGFYFAREATYVDDTLKARNGVKTMVMARVAVGAVLAGAVGMKAPFRGKSSSGRIKEADALVDAPQDPLTFVLSSEDCIYPAYVISYSV